MSSCVKGLKVRAAETAVNVTVGAASARCSALLCSERFLGDFGVAVSCVGVPGEGGRRERASERKGGYGGRNVILEKDSF